MLPDFRDNKWRFLQWALIFGTLFLYIYSEKYGSIVSWLFYFGLFICIARFYDGFTEQSGRFLSVTLLSFVVISFVGMVETNDNLRNFSTLFGKHADDTAFFLRTRDLLLRGSWDELNGLYEVTLAIFGTIPALAWGSQLDLLDILPFNWGIAALLVGLCDRLSEFITGHRPPHWLLTISLLCNYIFLDSVVHLYRDAFLFVFFLSGLLALLRGSDFRAASLSLPVLVLRGASFAQYFLFVLLYKIRMWLPSKTVYYGLCLAVGVSFVLLVPHVGNQVFKFSSGLQNMGESFVLPVSWSFQETMVFRSKMMEKQTAGIDNSTLARSVSGNDLKTMALRTVSYTFMPMRFWPINSYGESQSCLAATVPTGNTLFLMSLVEWISVICWVFVIPLLGLGMTRAIKGTPTENVLFVYYITAVLLVSFVSFQIRHGMAFIIMNPLVATLGYQMYRSNKRARLACTVGSFLVLIIIVAYSLFGNAIV